MQEIPEYSPIELRAFAEAAQAVFEVHQKYQPQLEAAASDKEREELVASAETEMRQAIESKGMSVELYDEILFAARADPELGMRVQALLDQLQ